MIYKNVAVIMSPLWWGGVLNYKDVYYTNQHLTSESLHLPLEKPLKKSNIPNSNYLINEDWLHSVDTTNIIIFKSQTLLILVLAYTNQET